MLAHPPYPLQDLYNGTDGASVHYRNNTRAYNCRLAMASTGMYRSQGAAPLLPGVENFKYHGRMFHRIGPLISSDAGRPGYAQLYIHDTDMDVRRVLSWVRRQTQSDLVETDASRCAGGRRQSRAGIYPL